MHALMVLLNKKFQPAGPERVLVTRWRVINYAQIIVFYFAAIRTNSFSIVTLGKTEIKARQIK